MPVSNITLTNTDYDLFLLSPDGSAVYDSSIDFQDGDDDPYEFIDSGPYNDTGSLLVIARYSGESRFLHLNTIRGELAIATDGQASGHACAENGFGVAAVDADGITTSFNGSESVQTYSSDGPRKIFYDEDGTAITPGDFSSTGGTTRQKPDITAADCVDTDTPGFFPFCGTSAAAPHAVAIAGLLLDADLTLTQSEIRGVLTSTALDIEALGTDRDSGSGIVDAFSAMNQLLGAGSVAVAGQSPPLTWNYELTHNLGELSTWTYTGTAITGATVDGTAAAAGWYVVSQTETQVIFATATTLTSGALMGFRITGTTGGMGHWTAGNNSGSIDNSLPVELSSFTGARTKNGVLISWRTESETNNIGFSVYRAVTEDGPFTNIGWIEGAGSTPSTHEYRFTDETAQPDETYFYFIEDVDVEGNRQTSAVVGLSDAVSSILRIQATASGHSILITWEDRKEIQPTNSFLTLYRALEPIGPYQEIARVDNSLYVDADVISGETYFYFLQGKDTDGDSIWSEVVSIHVALDTLFLPSLKEVEATRLYQNFPNPFNPETWMPYDLAVEADVSITIYNMTGTEIRTLSLGRKIPGTYLAKNRAAYWNGQDDHGENVSSGLYFYELTAGDFQETRRMILLK